MFEFAVWAVAVGQLRGIAADTFARNPAVALTIDTEDHPPTMPLIRGVVAM